MYTVYMSKWLYFKQFSLAYVRNLNIKNVLFQVIQFSISTQFNSNSPIERTLSGATILGQNGPGNDGSEGVLHISQSYNITGTSPSDCLLSYPGHSLRGGDLTQLQRCSQCILQPQLTEQYTELNVKTVFTSDNSV